MNAFKLFSLAWRNLWRQKRRTILTLVAIAFGGLLAVLMTALQDQSFDDFLDKAARMGAGHVTIENPDFYDKPTLSNTITNTDSKRSIAEADRAVTRAVDRASGQTMVSTASDSFGAMFIAYDPALETEETLEFTKGLVEGELFKTRSDDGIILGNILAENLDAQIGSKIVYTLTDRHGEIVTAMERVSGIVSTGAASTDSILVLLPIDTLRETVGYDADESSQVAVFLDDGRKRIAAANRIQRQLTDDASVLTFDQLMPEISAFIAMKIGGGRVFEVVIGVLVAAGIFMTIFMSVLERTREFGIMMAIGYSPRQLFILVMFESAILAVLGLISAVVVTALPYWYLQGTGIDMTEIYAQQGGGNIDIGGIGMDPILRIGIFPENLAVIAISIVVATLVAGIYPAWRAGRVNPVESINLV